MLFLHGKKWKCPKADVLTESPIVEDLRGSSDALIAARKNAKNTSKILCSLLKLKPLVILTKGLYAGENVVSGALLGLIKTVLQEYPIFDCRLVDTDNANDVATALAIKEPIQAFYDNKVYVHRLTAEKQVRK